MGEYAVIYRVYRVLLFAVGLIGFTRLVLDEKGSGARRAALLWIVAAASPWVVCVVLHALKLPEESMLPAWASRRHLILPAVGASGMLLLYPLRWRPGPPRAVLARAAASLAAGTSIGLCMNGVVLLSVFGAPGLLELLRISDETWNLETLHGLLFGAACFAASLAASRYPSAVRRSTLAAAAGLVLLSAGTAGWLKLRQPNRFWSTPRLIAALDSDPPPTYSCFGKHERRARQRAAARALGKKGVETLPFLREALAPGKPSRIRVGGAMALAGLGPAAQPAIPELVQALGAGEFSLPHYASQALGAVGPSAISAIEDAVAKGDVSVVYCGAALEYMVPAGRAAALAAARSLDRKMRSCAAYALGEIEPVTGEQAAALGALAEDEDEGVAWSAAMKLADLRENGRAAIPSLLRAIRRPRGEQEAAVALARIDPGNPKALPILLEALARPPRWGIYRDEYERNRIQELLWTLSGSYKGDRQVTAALERAVKRERKGGNSDLIVFERTLDAQSGRKNSLKP